MQNARAIQRQDLYDSRISIRFCEGLG